MNLPFVTRAHTCASADHGLCLKQASSHSSSPTCGPHSAPAPGPASRLALRCVGGASSSYRFCFAVSGVRRLPCVCLILCAHEGQIQGMEVWVVLPVVGAIGPQTQRSHTGSFLTLGASETPQGVPEVKAILLVVNRSAPGNFPVLLPVLFLGFTVSVWWSAAPPSPTGIHSSSGKLFLPPALRRQCGCWGRGRWTLPCEDSLSNPTPSSAKKQDRGETDTKVTTKLPPSTICQLGWGAITLP